MTPSLPIASAGLLSQAGGSAASGESTLPSHTPVPEASGDVIGKPTVGTYQTLTSYRTLRLGDRVCASQDRWGILRYIGNTAFKSGVWCGIELDEARGLNDGSVGGVAYFECATSHGVFLPADKVAASGSTSQLPSGACTPRIRGGLGSRQPSQESMMSAMSYRSQSQRSTAVPRTTRLGSSSYRGGGGGTESVTSPSAITSPRRSVNTSSTAPMNTIAALRDELAEREEQVERLRNERVLERATMSKAARQAEEAEDRLATVEQEHRALKAESDEIRAHLTELESDNDVLRRERDELRCRATDAERAQEELEFRLDEQRCLTEAGDNVERREIVLLQSKLAAKEQEISALREEMRKARADAELVEFRLADSATGAGQRLAVSEEQLEKERSASKELHSTIRSLEVRLALAAQNESSAEEVAQVRTELRAALTELAALRDSQHDERREFKRELAEATQRAASELAQAQRAAESERAEHRQADTAAEKRHRDAAERLAAELQASRSSFDDAERQRRELGTTVEQLSGTVASAEEKLAEAYQRVEKVQSEAAGAVERATNERDEQKQRVTDAERLVAQLRERCATLEGDMSSTANEQTTALESSRRQCAELTRHVEQIEAQLAAALAANRLADSNAKATRAEFDQLNSVYTEVCCTRNDWLVP